MDKIARAKAHGDDHVEVSKDVIDFYNKGGLGGAEFFYYQGIMVCEPGKYEKIKARHNLQIGQILHGDPAVLGR